MTAAKAKTQKRTAKQEPVLPTAWIVRADRVIELKPSAERAFAVEPKLQRIVDAIGLSPAADILGVDKSQLNRCLKRQEGISSELTRRISDMEYIIDRALQVMNPEDVGPWLASPEPLLGNSIPMNVLTLSGPSRVVRGLQESSRVSGT